MKKISRYSCDDYVCPKVNSVREKSRKRGRVCFIIGLFSEFEKTCDIWPNKITLIFFLQNFLGSRGCCRILVGIKSLVVSDTSM